MPFTYLEKLWERSLNPGMAGASDTWHKEVEALYSIGIGMEETLRYLYSEQPALETFKDWIKNRSRINETSSLDEDVLSATDLAFFEENGYVVIKQAVPQHDCEAAQKAMWEFLDMNPADKHTWYKGHNELRGLMLTFTDHPTLIKNRQSAKIKKAYEQLYKSTQLYKSIDKVSFNPPETSSFNFTGEGLHWDVSLKQPVPFRLQGLLYLTACNAADGAFNCVQGFHKTIGSWLQQLEPSKNPRSLVQTLPAVAVTGAAGDFVIWHQALPHCATANHGLNPRMVQYLTYLPMDYTSQKEWI